MPDPIYNLDDDKEFFTFTIFGYTYNFRYLTTEETDQLKKAFAEEKEDKKVMDMFLKYISSDDDKTPSFTETLKKMKNPHIKKFMVMMKTELGNEG